jgi:hypothetical protein
MVLNTVRGGVLCDAGRQMPVEEILPVRADASYRFVQRSSSVNSASENCNLIRSHARGPGRGRSGLKSTASG